eukprot:5265-Heterococcus_DN1.PRE.8
MARKKTQSENTHFAPLVAAAVASGLMSAAPSAYAAGVQAAFSDAVSAASSYFHSAPSAMQTLHSMTSGPSARASSASAPAVSVAATNAPSASVAPTSAPTASVTFASAPSASSAATPRRSVRRTPAQPAQRTPAASRRSTKTSRVPDKTNSSTKGPLKSTPKAKAKAKSESKEKANAKQSKSAQAEAADVLLALGLGTAAHAALHRVASRSVKAAAGAELKSKKSKSSKTSTKKSSRGNDSDTDTDSETEEDDVPVLPCVSLEELNEALFYRGTKAKTAPISSNMNKQVGASLTENMVRLIVPPSRSDDTIHVARIVRYIISRKVETAAHMKLELKANINISGANVRPRTPRTTRTPRTANVDINDRSLRDNLSELTILLSQSKFNIAAVFDSDGTGTLRTQVISSGAKNKDWLVLLITEDRHIEILASSNSDDTLGLIFSMNDFKLTEITFTRIMGNHTSSVASEEQVVNNKRVHDTLAAEECSEDTRSTTSSELTADSDEDTLQCGIKWYHLPKNHVIVKLLHLRISLLVVRL